MAMSLEDLLVDEGFKGRKSKTISRASSGIVSKSIPVYPTKDESKLGGLVRLKKTERAYSDVNRYDSSFESPFTDKTKGRRSIDVVPRDKSFKRSTNDAKERHVRRSSEDLQGVTRSSRSSTSTQNKLDNRDSRVNRLVNNDQSVGKLALDELAIKAIISILSDHTKRFIKDQEFRTSLHHSCLSVLNSTNRTSELKVISKLERAIETVERATEKQTDEKSLKKACLQISVLTGLNANDLKDGFTNGISNSILSACGHLYLSVIYQLQKKERISARHLLQVFIDSPFSARTKMVQELWDDVFHPHLLHLDDWYNQEVDYLKDDASNTRGLKKVKKLYDEILDGGTYKLALYYKDWLTDGVEAPTLPTIDVPLVSFRGIHQGGSFGHDSLDFSTPIDAFTPHHMVGKKLNDYQTVVSEVEDHQTMQRSNDGSMVEDKLTVTRSSEEKEYKDLHIKQYGESSQDGPVDQEAFELHRANALANFRNAILQQEGLKNTNTLQPLPIAKVNELTLKLLAKSVFKPQQNEICVAVIDDSQPQIETRPIGGEKIRFFCNIPQDYLCPLTGLLFVDPVTLANGQTYERVAIAEWFSNGNKTCPVTGELLEHHNVPQTNLILNRVINGWKVEHSRNVLASACQVAESPLEQKFKDEAAIFILDHLITVFGEEEDKRIGKHLTAFGGLHFLVKRFEYGNLDEKARVARLLLCSIKADSSCRINVTKLIEKQCLFELLHYEEIKSRTNVVLLLFELVCLNRRKDVQIFLDGLQKESITSLMQILLVFLHDCSPEQKPLVAMLLLHLDIMVDKHRYSKYKEQAVDAITSAMDTSFSDEKIRITCGRTLLILGGRISFSGKVMTEDWILKKAGFLDGHEIEVQEDEVTIKPECKEENEAVNDWLMIMTTFILGDGNKSFLYSLSRCLNSGHRDMSRVSLTTMAWLSSTLASLPNYKSCLSVFSVVINQLKQNLKDGQSVENRILATMSLLNFSKIPECKELLMTIADEITIPLSDLCEATWMAKELYDLICQNDISH